jgi:hypothetical protein
MWEKYGTARQLTDDNIIRRIRKIRFAFRKTKATTKTHTLTVFLYNGISGYANAPNCYVIHTLPVLLMLNLAVHEQETLHFNVLKYVKSKITYSGSASSSVYFRSSPFSCSAASNYSTPHRYYKHFNWNVRHLFLVITTGSWHHGDGCQ